MLRATEEEVERLTTLFNDCGFTRQQRADLLRRLCRRTIYFLEELTSDEVADVTTELLHERKKAWDGQNCGKTTEDT